MDAIGIEIKRDRRDDWDYDPSLLLVYDGNKQGEAFIEWRWYGNHLKDIGKVLRRFPRKLPDDYSYRIDSETTTDLILHAHAGKTGPTTLEIIVGPIGSPKEERFLIITRNTEIQRLGNLLLEFLDQKYRFLKWSLKDDSDALLEWEKRKPKPLWKRLRRFWKLFNYYANKGTKGSNPHDWSDYR